LKKHIKNFLIINCFILAGCAETPVYPNWNSFVMESSAHNKIDSYKIVPVPDIIPEPFQTTTYSNPFIFTF
jgi:hypothetical protein